MPYDNITEDGVIISKNKFIKILKITPISYELKSELEKKAILEAYKLFLRTCNFDIQILIQSKKENILKNIQKIQFENDEIIDVVKEEYILYIKRLSSNKELSSKNFFILINIPRENIKKEILNLNNVKLKFADMILKISDTLLKCGNKTVEIIERREVIEIIDTFLNPYKEIV